MQHPSSGLLERPEWQRHAVEFESLGPPWSVQTPRNPIDVVGAKE